MTDFEFRGMVTKPPLCCLPLQSIAAKTIPFSPLLQISNTKFDWWTTVDCIRKKYWISVYKMQCLTLPPSGPCATCVTFHNTCSRIAQLINYRGIFNRIVQFMILDLWKRYLHRGTKSSPHQVLALPVLRAQYTKLFSINCSVYENESLYKILPPTFNSPLIS